MAFDNPRPSSQPEGSTEMVVAKDNLTMLDLIAVSTELSIDNRKGQPRLTFAGMDSGFADTIAQGEVDIATAIAAAGYQIIGDFADVIVAITDANQALTSKSVVGFEDYVWRTNQPLPYTRTGSDPTQAPELGKWLAVSIGELETVLIGLNALLSDGIYSTDTVTPIPKFIRAKDQQETYSVPAGAIGKTIVSVVGSTLNTTVDGPYVLRKVSTDNVVVTVDAAVGDWNITTQTGTDATAAIQAAVDNLSGQTRRNGGRPILKFPTGNYHTTGTINLKGLSVFDLLIIGDGWQGTTIWGEVGAGDYVFESDLEFYGFKDIAIIGNGLESRTNMALGTLNAFNRAGAADIDVEFTDCYLGWATSLGTIKGRGFTISGGTVVNVDYMLDIVSPDPWVQRGSNDTDTVSTGMRNYSIKGTRFDGVSRVVRTPQTGPAAGYINDINITGGCSFTAVDRLIEVGANGVGGRILGAVITGNTALFSFAGGIITGNDVEGLTMTDNDFAKLYDITKAPTTTGETIDWVCDLRNAITIDISNNVIKPLRFGVVTTSNLGFMRGVSVTENKFPNYTRFTDASDTYVLHPVNGVNASGLIVANNTFDSISAPTSANWYMDSDVDATDVTVSGNIVLNFDMIRHLNNFTPVLYAGGIPSVGHTVSNSNLNWYTDESYLYATVACSFSAIVTTGALSVTLPKAGFPENPAVSSISAIAPIAGIFGLSLATGDSPSPCRVLDSAFLNLRKWDSSAGSNANIEQVELASGSISFVATVKYRYKL